MSWQFDPGQPQYTADDLPEIRAGLIDQMDGLVAHLFGNTKTITPSSKEIRVGNNGSLVINKSNDGGEPGRWFNHEQGVGDGDLLSLIAHVEHLDIKNDFPQVLDKARQFLGMPARSATNPQRQAANKQPWKDTPYDYLEPDGSIRYRVVRRERGDERKFQQCRFDETGKPIWNLTGVTPLPFNLPNIIASEWCIIVEGEKDVLRLAEYGLPATCNSGGSGNWKSDLNQWFAGKSVFIIPDNDAPGRKHARAIAAQLLTVAKSVAIAAICADLPEKSDISDWFDLGYKPDELTTALAQCKAFTEADATRGDLDPKTSKGSASQWEDPIDIFGDDTLAGIPNLPEGVLPTVIEAYARDKAVRLGVDPAMIGIPALAVAAAALDDRFQLQPRVHDIEWQESARLWVAIVEESGGRKTPAARAAMDPLFKIEKRWAEEDAIFAEGRQVAERIYNSKMNKYVKTKADDKQADLPEAPAEFYERRRVVSDITIDAMSEVLKGNPAGVLAFNDELSGWIGSFDVFKGNQAVGRDRALWLELHNGGPKPVDRVKRGRILVPNWGASMLGGIQPGPIKKMTADLTNDGLLQRFIIIHGNQYGPGVDRPANLDATSAYQQAIENLVATEFNQQAVTVFSEQAHADRNLVVQTAEAVKALPDTSPAFRSHLSKWEALFCRLALTFHALETAGTGFGSIAVPVPESTSSRVAVLMLDFLLPNAAKFYADTFGRGDDAEHARWVAGHILAHQLEKVSTRDIGRAYGTLRNDPTGLQKAMAVLHMAAWVDPVNPDRFGHAKRWSVNPRVLSKFSEKAEAEKKRREAEIQKVRQATRFLQNGELMEDVA